MVDSIINSFCIWTNAQGLKSKVRVKSIENISLKGMSHLRELILELAIRGKLVSQDQNDEPASVLLDKIRKEKKLLIRDGKIKKTEDSLEIAEKDKEFALPDKWIHCRLGTLFNSLSSGGTPSKNNPDFWNGEIPWASVKDIGSSKYLYETQDYITQKGLAAGSKLADIDDVIICTRMGLGKIAIAKTPIAINQDLKAVKLTSFLNVDYFFIFYSTLKIKGTGTTVSGIKQEELLNYILPLPPLAEQKRIADKVEELMALCEKLEEELVKNLCTHQLLVKTLLDTLSQARDADELQMAWQQMCPHIDTIFCTEGSIDQLKETILQLATIGKLVKQDPNDENATALIKKIEKEKARLINEGILKKEKTPTEIPDKKKPFDLPYGWVWCSLREVGFITGGGTPSTSKVSYWGGNIPWVTPKDMKMDFISDSEDKVTMAGVNNSPMKLIPPNSVLIVGRSGILKRTLPVSINVVECVVNQDMKVIVPYLAGMDRYLQLMLKGYEKFILQKLVKYGMTVHSLMYREFENHPFPLPPFDEQKRIVAKIEELMALCNNLKERILKAEEIKGLLSETIIESVLV